MCEAHWAREACVAPDVRLSLRLLRDVVCVFITVVCVYYCSTYYKAVREGGCSTYYKAVREGVVAPQKKRLWFVLGRGMSPTGPFTAPFKAGAAINRTLLTESRACPYLASLEVSREGLWPF